jgi:hypothetical protein
MTTRNKELWLAFFAILFITFFYMVIVTWYGETPAASGFFGHSIGILGFLLMILTESLYSLRKRSRSARWGKMSGWLQFHIFTGIVGPFMVLLHTSWKFNGLAGIVLLLTILIVISGFFGRYIYTAVPRTADGAELQKRLIMNRIHETELSIDGWLASQPDETQQAAQQLLALSSFQGSSSNLVITRIYYDAAFRLALLRQRNAVPPRLRVSIEKIQKLIVQKRELNQQMQSIAEARKLLALWHTIHIPIGLALFTAALIHIGAAIYYASFLH